MKAQARKTNDLPVAEAREVVVDEKYRLAPHLNSSFSLYLNFRSHYIYIYIYIILFIFYDHFSNTVEKVRADVSTQDVFANLVVTKTKKGRKAKATKEVCTWPLLACCRHRFNPQCCLPPPFFCIWLLQLIQTNFFVPKEGDRPARREDRRKPMPILIFSVFFLSYFFSGLD